MDQHFTCLNIYGTGAGCPGAGQGAFGGIGRWGIQENYTYFKFIIPFCTFQDVKNY
jgi:hypothetical protein